MGRVRGSYSQSTFCYDLKGKGWGNVIIIMVYSFQGWVFDRIKWDDESSDQLDGIGFKIGFLD